MNDAGAVVDGLAIALLAVALFSVTVRGLVAGVWLLIVQSVLLSLVAAAIALWSGAAHMWAAALLTFTVRAIAVPAVLLWILRAVALRRETRPLLSTRHALMLAGALTLIAFFAAGRLKLSDAFPAHDALPVSFALIFVGLLLMATRRKAVSQLIGLITIENGIFLAGLIARDVDPLQKIVARLCHENNRLCCLELNEKQPVLAPITPPPGQQLHRGPRDSGESLIPPGPEPIANERNQFQLNRRAGGLSLVCRWLCLRITIEINSPAPSGNPLWHFPLLNIPVLSWLFKGRIQYGLGNFVVAHNLNAFWIPSSFSTTSGWISSGRMRAAIS